MLSWSADTTGRSGVSMTRPTPTQLSKGLDWLKDQKTKAQESLKKMSNRIRRIEILELEAMDLQKQLKDTTDRIDELNVESKVGGRIEVITDGERPLTPIQDRRIAASAFGASAGFVLPLLIIMVGIKVAPVRRT